MELGKGKLRRNGMNNLLNSLHEQHGLLWTDGKGIYLAPVHLKHDHTLDNAPSLRLGEFDNVQSVHWSCGGAGGGCYMGAVHQASVTVWQVSGATPHLAFKQVRKISVQPIPQGCLWNPQCDVVCLLSHQQCSFYFRHTHNRGSFAFPSLENGKISCGCWSPDGKRLVICVGTALLIYTWTDIEANINDFVTTAWRIPGVSGHITAIVAASDSSVVCATALPLDLLCTNNNNNHHDSLAFPGVGNSQPGADGVLRPHGAPSVKDTLLSLHLAAKGEVQDTAMLSVVQLRSGVHDPCVVTSAVVPGLLSPDLLHFQMESQCVVVGSNTQSGLQVFALLENQLAFAGHLTLGKEERPKGVCGLRASRSAGSHGVLVLAGKTEAGDAAFPSANNTAHFSLALTFFPTCPEKARQLMNGLVRSTKTTSSVPLPKPEAPREPRAKSVSDSKLLASKGEQLNHRPPHEDRGDSPAVRMSISGTDSSRRSGSKLMEDITTDGSPPAVDADRRVSASQVLETERADFTQTAPQFSNSVLAERYEMNRSEHGQGSVSNAPCKSPPGVSHREGMKGGKAGDRMTNGHSGADREVAKFFLPDASEEGSVRAGPLDPQQQTTSPALSGGQTHRGGKEGSGGEGEGEGGSLSSSFNSSDSNYELLEKQIQVQRDQIDALQRKLADLSMMVEDTACVFPIRYQSATEPEAATVHCVVGGKSVSRKFLLDNGRLQLDPVKQAFGLLTVELILDGEPLVLGANIDGYIPMKFSADSQLQITGIPMAFSPQTKPRSHRKDTS
ncbi:hypothetical protein ACOMHN_055419 [Nucella lapillus]